MEFSMSFPAIRGLQAQKEFYSIMCPLDLLSKLFSFYNDETPEEFRAQRYLNEKRIPEIRDYILNNSDTYVFSSITASIDGDFVFEPNPQNENIGMLKVSMTSRFLVNDGQHRKAAIDAALKERPALKSESISVVLYIDKGLKQSQQMFSDLNRHAVNVSNSLNVLYDHRDPIAFFTRNLLTKHPRLDSLIDKSNNSIGKKSKKIFKLSNLRNAIAVLFGKADISSNDDLQTFAIEYWTYLFENFNEWKHIINGEVSAYSSRHSSIATYGLVLEAFGILGGTLYLSNKTDWKKNLDLLNEIDWSRSNPNWLNRFVHPDGSIKNSTLNTKLISNKIKELIHIDLSSDDLKEELKFRKEHHHV